jgi:hypothetical protein
MPVTFDACAEPSGANNDKANPIKLIGAVCQTLVCRVESEINVNWFPAYLPFESAELGERDERRGYTKG